MENNQQEGQCSRSGNGEPSSGFGFIGGNDQVKEAHLALTSGACEASRVATARRPFDVDALLNNSAVVQHLIHNSPVTPNYSFNAMPVMPTQPATPNPYQNLMLWASLQQHQNLTNLQRLSHLSSTPQKSPAEQAASEAMMQHAVKTAAELGVAMGKNCSGGSQSMAHSPTQSLTLMLQQAAATSPSLAQSSGSGIGQLLGHQMAMIQRNAEIMVTPEKRSRTVFSMSQLDELEKIFRQQQYVVGSERTELAFRLRLTEAQVKVWFQNRRIKHRKQLRSLQATNQHVRTMSVRASGERAQMTPKATTSHQEGGLASTSGTSSMTSISPISSNPTHSNTTSPVLLAQLTGQSSKVAQLATPLSISPQVKRETQLPQLPVHQLQTPQAFTTTLPSLALGPGPVVCKIEHGDEDLDVDI